MTTTTPIRNLSMITEENDTVRVFIGGADDNVEFNITEEGKDKEFVFTLKANQFREAITFVEGVDILALKKRIADLEEDERLLRALEAHGVDNWEGYGDAKASLSTEQG